MNRSTFADERTRLQRHSKSSESMPSPTTTHEMIHEELNLRYTIINKDTLEGGTKCTTYPVLRPYCHCFRASQVCRPAPLPLPTNLPQMIRVTVLSSSQCNRIEMIIKECCENKTSPKGLFNVKGAQEIHAEIREALSKTLGWHKDKIGSIVKWTNTPHIHFSRVPGLA